MSVLEAVAFAAFVGSAPPGAALAFPAEMTAEEVRLAMWEAAERAGHPMRPTRAWEDGRDVLLEWEALPLRWWGGDS